MSWWMNWIAISREKTRHRLRMLPKRVIPRSKTIITALICHQFVQQRQVRIILVTGQGIYVYMEGIITCKVVLDPRFKTKVYERLGGFTPRIIKDIRGRCNEVYLTYRQHMDEPVVDANAIDNVAVGNEDTSMDYDPFMAKLFGLETQGSNPCTSFQQRQELNEYLAIPTERGRDVDPLEWWKKNQAQFPVLSKVAQDYLAIPGPVDMWFFLFIYICWHVMFIYIGSSAPVERIFSRGKRLISPVRSSLAPETVRACMLVKDKLLNKNKRANS